MESAKKITFGILRETYSAWERRVALTPAFVRELTKRGHPVVVQPCPKRCFVDKEYEAAGAVLSEDLAQVDWLFGIKPQRIDDLLPNKTLFHYGTIYTGDPTIQPYLEAILEKKIRAIEFEKIKEGGREEGMGLVGSSPLAGNIGVFNTIRGVGEMLLVKHGISTPMLHTGAAYMHASLDDCV